MSKQSIYSGLFARQLPLFGSEGQERLHQSTLLIAGLGGLGSVVAEQLVRLGIGTLYLVDNGTIDLPDLNRQILYQHSDIGQLKCEITAKRLSKLGLFTRLIPVFETIDDHFTLPDRLIGIVDCLDNMSARYILDDLIRQSNIFMIHGAVHGFIGQATTIVPNQSKSLRQIYSNQFPDSGTIPVSAQIPGIIASIQAKEVINLICGQGETLINRLFWIDLSDYRSEITDISS